MSAGIRRAGSRLQGCIRRNDELSYHSLPGQFPAGKPGLLCTPGENVAESLLMLYDLATMMISNRPVQNLRSSTGLHSLSQPEEWNA